MEVFRSLVVVEGIVDRRRCARAKLIVQLRERYRRLITRGIVSPRNLSQVTSAMKPGQECMVGFCFGKENNTSRRVILKIELRIKQPKLNLVTIGRDSSFPSILGLQSPNNQVSRTTKGCCVLWCPSTRVVIGPRCPPSSACQDCD